MEAAFLALGGRAAFLSADAVRRGGKPSADGDRSRRGSLPGLGAWRNVGSFFSEGSLPLYVALNEGLFLGLNVALLFVTEK